MHVRSSDLHSWHVQVFRLALDQSVLALNLIWLALEWFWLSISQQQQPVDKLMHGTLALTLLTIIWIFLPWIIQFISPINSLSTYEMPEKWTHGSWNWRRQKNELMSVGIEEMIGLDAMQCTWKCHRTLRLSSFMVCTDWDLLYHVKFMNCVIWSTIHSVSTGTIYSFLLKALKGP